MNDDDVVEIKVEDLKRLLSGFDWQAGYWNDEDDIEFVNRIESELLSDD